MADTVELVDGSARSTPPCCACWTSRRTATSRWRSSCWRQPGPTRPRAEIAGAAGTDAPASPRSPRRAVVPAWRSPARCRCCSVFVACRCSNRPRWPPAAPRTRRPATPVPWTWRPAWPAWHRRGAAGRRSGRSRKARTRDVRPGRPMNAPHPLPGAGARTCSCPRSAPSRRCCAKRRKPTRARRRCHLRGVMFPASTARTGWHCTRRRVSRRTSWPPPLRTGLAEGRPVGGRLPRRGAPLHRRAGAGPRHRPLTPPDADGFCSPGVAADFLPMVGAARSVAWRTLNRACRVLAAAASACT